VAQPKNKKRRSRKRARSAGGGAGPARPSTSADGAPAPSAPGASAAPAAKVSKARRAQKAREVRKAAPGPPTIKADRSEAPQPVWAPLPITEGLILVGIIAAVVGLFSQSTGLVLGGLAVLMLSSLELAVREHMAGYRSHTSLISAVVALLSAIGLGVVLNLVGANLPQWPLLVVAVVVFAVVFRTMRAAFKRRSGGLSYRV
jgi:hypothetical protein